MPPMPRELTASTAKQRFGDILGHCMYGGGRVVITKHKRPVAVLVGMEEWNRREVAAKNSGDDDEPDIVRRARELTQRMWEHMPDKARKNPVGAAQIVRMIRDEES